MVTAPHPLQKRKGVEYHPVELQFCHSPIEDLGIPAAGPLRDLISGERRWGCAGLMYCCGRFRTSRPSGRNSWGEGKGKGGWRRQCGRGVGGNVGAYARALGRSTHRLFADPDLASLPPSLPRLQTWSRAWLPARSCTCTAGAAAGGPAPWARACWPACTSECRDGR